MTDNQEKPTWEDVVLWYYEKGFSVKKLINNRNKDVRPAQVKAAMRELYKNYDRKLIGLGHAVQNLATTINDEELILEELQLATAHDQAIWHKERAEKYKNWFIGSIALWVWFFSIFIVRLKKVALKGYYKTHWYDFEVFH